MALAGSAIEPTTRLEAGNGPFHGGWICGKNEAHLFGNPANLSVFSDPTPVGFATSAHTKCTFIVWLLRDSDFGLLNNYRLSEESKASTSDGNMPVNCRESRVPYRLNIVNSYFAMFN